MAERVQGLAELQRQLRQLEPVIKDAVIDAVRESAEAAQEQAQRDVPVWRGNLRRGVRIRYRAGGLAAEVGVFDPDLYYVMFVHQGTSSITAVPFLTWAGEAERPRLRGRLEQHIARALTR